MISKITGCIVLAAVVITLFLNGCAVPSGGCPYCGYPPGVLLDGDVVRCPRCQGQYRVYLDGSVRVIQRPSEPHPAPAPTNNTGATQRSLNQTGLFLLEGLSQ